MARIVAGIDVGTTKVCTLIAEVEGEAEGAPPMVRIIGFGRVRSRGIKKGGVVNIPEVTRAIAESVDAAERLAGVDITSAYVSITGAQVASQNSRGKVMVYRRRGGITEDDIARVVEVAKAVAVPHNRQILHAIPRSFVVDGQEGVQDPRGMDGSRLEVEVHIITVSSSAVNNLTKCVRRAGVEVEGLVFAPLASGEAVLTSAEREMGVVVADVGGGTTDVAVYVEGSPAYVGVIEVGGEYITGDIAHVLNMPPSSAEDVKKKYGHAISDDIPEGESFDAYVFGDRSHRTVPRRYLAEIIQARVEELFELIFREAQRSGYVNRLPAGIVLCGGTALLSGISELGQDTLNLPVRVGRPRGVEGIAEVLEDPSYATAVGLVLWPLRRQEFKTGVEEGPRWFERLWDWLKTLLPY